jgi:hypothetical protein
MQNKIIIWSLINCFLPVLPVILIWFGFWLSTKPDEQFKPVKTITLILGDGQLFFYCVSLFAGTISDLVNEAASQTISSNNLLTIVVLLVGVVGTTLFYGQVIRIKIEQDDNEQVL